MRCRCLIVLCLNYRLPLPDCLFTYIIGCYCIISLILFYRILLPVYTIRLSAGYCFIAIIIPRIIAHHHTAAVFYRLAILLHPAAVFYHIKVFYYPATLFLLPEAFSTWTRQVLDVNAPAGDALSRLKTFTQPPISVPPLSGLYHWP
jgi:hypothetical protein